MLLQLVPRCRPPYVETARAIQPSRVLGIAAATNIVIVIAVAQTYGPGGSFTISCSSRIAATPQDCLNVVVEASECT
jgi:hypothetical protein